MYALVNLASDPFLSRYYSIHWQIIPNLAMDIIVPPLIHYFNLFLASKIFTFMFMGLMLTGPLAIQKSLFGRLSVWPLVSFVFIFNWIFMYGFTNFLFGVGVALWAIAAWIALRERHPALRFFVSLLFSLVLFISHLHALGLYGLTIFSYEIWRRREHRPRAPVRVLIVDLFVFCVPFMMMLALLAASSTASSAGVTRWVFLWKFDALFYALKNFWTPLDLAIGAGAVIGVFWAGWKGLIEVHRVAWYVLAASTLVFLGMPFKILGSSFADSRLPIAMLFILIGMVRWRALQPWSSAIFCAVVGVVSIVRFAVVAFAWHYLAGVYADFEKSFQVIPPGSKIFTTRKAEKGMRQTYADLFIHIPVLAMAERSSLETLAFTDPAKTVLVTKPEFRSIVAYEGLPPLIEFVARGEIDPDATSAPVTNADYYLRWRDSYDYMYVLYARKGMPAPMQGLSLVYQGKEFQLYKIEHPPSQKSR